MRYSSPYQQIKENAFVFWPDILPPVLGTSSLDTTLNRQFIEFSTVYYKYIIQWSKTILQAVLTQVFGAATWEAEQISMSSRSTRGIPDQPGLHSETLSND